MAVSAWERARATSTVTSSSRQAVSSSASRDFPIPASPAMVTNAGIPVWVARARHSRRIVSSLDRPTSGMVRRAERVVRPSTGYAERSSVNPLARMFRRTPNATSDSVSVWVVPPASTSPGPAAVWSRAAAFTTGPVTRSCPAGPTPVAATPDSMPTRTRSGSASPSALPRRRRRPRIARPARTARSASSSWTVGSPNTAITASPMNFSGRPRRACNSSVAASKNAPRTSRARSGSRRSPRPVESTRSAKRTVIILRSSVPSGVATAAPQLGQKRALGGSGWPHTGQSIHAA